MPASKQEEKHKLSMYGSFGGFCFEGFFVAQFMNGKCLLETFFTKDSTFQEILLQRVGNWFWSVNLSLNQE